MADLNLDPSLVDNSEANLLLDEDLDPSGSDSRPSIRSWTKDDDAKLIQAVENTKFRFNWDEIAVEINNGVYTDQGLDGVYRLRTARACRERWSKIGRAELSPHMDGSLFDSSSYELPHLVADQPPAPLLPTLPTLPSGTYAPVSNTSQNVVRGRPTQNQSALEGKAKKIHCCPATECDAAFKRSEHLKRHFRSVHLNSKPFPCPVDGCGKNFSRKDNLQQHSVMVHGVRVPATLSDPEPTPEPIPKKSRTARADSEASPYDVSQLFGAPSKRSTRSSKKPGSPSEDSLKTLYAAAFVNNSDGGDNDAMTLLSVAAEAHEAARKSMLPEDEEPPRRKTKRRAAK